MRKYNHKAQSTLEYAILIAVVVGALVAIQIYLKRGIQGKMRDSADQVGEQFDAHNTSVTKQVISHTGKTVQVVGNKTTTSTLTDDTRRESGSENVGNL